MIHAPEDAGPLSDVTVAGHLLSLAHITLVAVDGLVVGTQQPVSQQVIHVHDLPKESSSNVILFARCQSRFV